MDFIIEEKEFEFFNGTLMKKVDIEKFHKNNDINFYLYKLKNSLKNRKKQDTKNPIKQSKWNKDQDFITISTNQMEIYTFKKNDETN